MKLFDATPSLINAVKDVMEKKMTKDELAALGGDKRKVDAEDFEALRNGEHKKKHKKKHHVKEEEIIEGFEIGQVYHIGKDENRAYFIPKEVQKNGKHKGMQFDSGAAGRSSKKPTTFSYDYSSSWKKTPADEIPSHIKVHLKEEEILDERNKENKFKKDLYVAKKGVEHATKNWGFAPKDHASMSRAFGHDKPTERDNMKSLLKDYKRRGRAMAKEEVEQVDELDVETLKNYRTKSLNQASVEMKKGLRGEPNKLKKRLDGYHKASDKIDKKVMGGLGKKAASARHYNEETEVVEGSTYGVSTPLKTKGTYTSENGRHVAKVRRDRDWNEWRVELHTDGKHLKNADYHTDDKEEAHENAKAMVAHAQKHEKPLKESVYSNSPSPKPTSYDDGKSGFTPKGDKKGIVKKIINKYTK